MSFQMQIHTLSCFPVMPFNVFPSKSQKRVHAHIETSFWFLKGMTQIVTAQKELNRTERTQQAEKTKNCRSFLLSGKHLKHGFHSTLWCLHYQSSKELPHLSQPTETHWNGLLYNYRLVSVQIGGLEVSLEKFCLSAQSTEISKCRNL